MSLCNWLADPAASLTTRRSSRFGAEAAQVLVTPVQTPNAFTERWVPTVRAECLDWLLIVGRGHLEQVLGCTWSTTTPIARIGRWS